MRVSCFKDILLLKYTCGDKLQLKLKLTSITVTLLRAQ